MTELRPEVADLDPRLLPLSKQTFDIAGIDVVVNTHLHFDHCGGNHLFAGRPIYVQRRELDDARSEDDYTIREWVEAPGVRYVPVDGELELLPGLRLVPAPGHTPGSQVVVVETGGQVGPGSFAPGSTLPSQPDRSGCIPELNVIVGVCCPGVGRDSGRRRLTRFPNVGVRRLASVVSPSPSRRPSSVT
jgi:Metallo-beta-lactamase superfamily